MHINILFWLELLLQTWIVTKRSFFILFVCLFVSLKSTGFNYLEISNGKIFWSKPPLTMSRFMQLGKRNKAMPRNLINQHNPYSQIRKQAKQVYNVSYECAYVWYINIINIISYFGCLFLHTFFLCFCIYLLGNGNQVVKLCLLPLWLHHADDVSSFCLFFGWNISLWN